MSDYGQIANQRLETIAACSETGPGVTRRPFTSQHRDASDLIAEWMRAAGLDVHMDDAGTLIGRCHGPSESGTFYLGSHQDSIRHGGKFDGIMGIVLPVLALQKLRDDGVTLPFSVEVLAFADEEGVRFPTALMGPRALAGKFDPETLGYRDAQGVRLEDAMRDFGLNPSNVKDLGRSASQSRGYLEVHIEQGPVLEEADEPLGIVSAICGIERHQITLTGETGHAGTLPMHSRRDALVGAADIVSEVFRLASESTDLRGTVGSLQLSPNVVNAVPREVQMSLELRSPQDTKRESAARHIKTYCESIARQRNLTISMERTYRQNAQPCDDTLSGLLRNVVQEVGCKGMVLPSGATHDASAMADLCPVSMLFVRCTRGLSHVPEEQATPGDMSLAVHAVARFLRAIA